VTEPVPPLRDPQGAQWRRARRAAAWRHHPDRGGTAAEFVAALAAVDNAVATNESAGLLLTIRRSRRARLTRRLYRWRRRRMGRRYFTL
jgi:hypothetical protein